jgi:predicted phage terminase large subunit-like protein
MEGLTPQSSLDDGDVRTLRLQAEKSFYFFAKAVLGFKDLTAHIHKPLCDMLQNMVEGVSDVSQLTGARNLVMLPRGWFKTTVASIAFPVWLSLKFPNIMILLVQNTYTNAEGKLRSIKGIYEGNELFRALWPERLPTKDCKWVKDSLCINRSRKDLPQSTFECAGIGVQLTSRHYDLIIEDDTVAPELNELGEENLAPSKESIGQAIGFHKLINPLLVDPKRSMILVIGTRWFEKDLLSHIMDNEKWFKCYIRACRENDEGKADPKGKLTFPERFDDQALSQLEQSMGPYMFSCLYLNAPMASADMVFRIDWIQYFEEEPYGLEVYTHVDLAGDASLQKGTDNDYNVVMTTGKHRGTGRIYVLHYWRKRTNPGEVVDEIFRQEKVYNPRKVVVESVGYQNTLIYWLNEEMAKQKHYFLVEDIKHGRTSKEARIRGLQPLFAAGHVYLRNWMTPLADELKVFPLGAHDDLIDCLAMGLSLWGVLSPPKRLKTQENDDYLSFDRAVEEIYSRKKRAANNSPVLDLEESPSLEDQFMFN